MKNIFSIILVCLAFNSVGQTWYSKTFDPFNEGDEAASIMYRNHDTLIIRGGAPCISNTLLCSLLGEYLLSERKFNNVKHFDDIQTGGKNLLVSSDVLLLASQEAMMSENISLSQVDRTTFEHINTIELKIDDARYNSYTVKKSIIYRDKIIVTGQVLNNDIFINYPGWHNYQENAILFVLDSFLNVDTVLIIPPSSGAFLKIEDLSIGPDSILYISFYEKYLKSGSSEDFLENRKVIYGLDKDYNIVFQWIGPDFPLQESLSNLTISKDTNIYLNYKKDYKTYVASIDKDGSTNWESVLDSTIGENLYAINNIILAENGDVIGAGAISSVIDELGQSGFLFRIDTLGKLKWKKAIRINKGFDLTVPLEFPFQSVLEDLVELPSGDLVSIGYIRKFVGFESPNDPYNFDIWILQTNSEGCLWQDCPYIQDIISKDEYLPLVYAGNEWVVDSTSLLSPNEIHRYSFSHDSIMFDGKYYFELIYKSTIQGPWQETSRFMRQDNGKVFEYNPIDLSEILLYDFDLQIGDTLIPYADGTINQRRVVKVEGVTLIDGLPRKALTIECTSDMHSPDTTIWIEGMGDLERLFWSKTFCSTLDENDTINAIRCFLMDKQTRYSRPELGDCYITAVNEISNESVLVFPNPAFDLIHFDIEDNHFVDKILLYNTIGQLVLSNELLPNYTLDISFLAEGIYYGVIHFQRGTSQNFRILIL